MSKKDRCDIYCYNEEKVDRIQQELQNENLTDASKLFKVLADENRLKIAYALSLDGELCVCDIANIIDSSVATASHHLRTLYKQELVNYRKEGKLAFYFLKDVYLKQLIRTALALKREGEELHV